MFIAAFVHFGYFEYILEHGKIDRVGNLSLNRYWMDANMRLKKTVLFATICFLALGVTVGILLFADTSESAKIVAKIINPVDACACIPLSVELDWKITDRMETEFTPMYGVNEVKQVIPNNDNGSEYSLGLFAALMAREDGSGNKLFIIDYQKYDVIGTVIEVSDIVCRSDAKLEVVSVPGIEGWVLQVHTASQDNDRVTLITFDLEYRIIGEFEITRHNNGKIALQEVTA